MKPNRLVIIYRIMRMKTENLQDEQILQFKEDIKRIIEDRNTVTATDALVKDGRISRC